MSIESYIVSSDRTGNAKRRAEGRPERRTGPTEDSWSRAREDEERGEVTARIKIE